MAVEQLGHDQSSERSIGGQIGPDQDPADSEAGGEQVAAASRRRMEHRDRLANERKRRPNSLQPLPIGLNRQVTGLPPRRRAQLRQVESEALLQLARTARRDQGRARRPPADVDEEARAVGGRAGAGKCRGGSARPARRANRGDDDDSTVHGAAGLA